MVSVLFWVERSIFRVALVLALIPACATWWAAEASGAEWRIDRLSGDVRVFGQDQRWITARAGQHLKTGDAIWTGKRSRAQLSTEHGIVILKARTLVKVPSRKLPDGTSVLLHGQGAVSASVRKKRNRHFSIQTPFLAAVVKGTRFSVESETDGSRLSVTEGVVAAVSVSTGEMVDVTEGQSISLSGIPGASMGDVSDGGSADHQGMTGHENDPVEGGSEYKRSGQFSQTSNWNGSGNGDDDDDDDDDDD